MLDVLRAVGDADCVIIGGQAVNLWSERYAKAAPPWTDLRPFTSVDLDLLGGRREVLQVAKLLKVSPYLPLADENTANSGKLRVLLGDAELEVDFLHTANGINTQEAFETAPLLTFEGTRLRVLHPVLCVESKTVNLATLPQHADSRQDLKHLRLSLANTCEYLAELTRQDAKPASLLRWARRLRRNANHQLGLTAARLYHVDFQEAVPKALWAQQGGGLADFVREEWTSWSEEVSRKLAEELEIEQWLQKLNLKPESPET